MITSIFKSIINISYIKNKLKALMYPGSHGFFHSCKQIEQLLIYLSINWKSVKLLVKSVADY